jgi:pilus assembly protein Flp/PilA
MELLRRLHSDETGQGLAEYTLLIALIAIALITVVTQFSGKLGEIFDSATNELDGRVLP